MVEVVWANPSRASRLNYQANLFLRELTSYMMDQLAQVMANPSMLSNYSGYSSYQSQQPTTELPNRYSFSNYIWRALQSASKPIQEVYLPPRDSTTIEPDISNAVDDAIGDYFVNQEIFNASYEVQDVSMIVMWPNRYNAGNLEWTREIFDDDAKYIVTVVQYFSPGSLDGVYHQTCNRRTADYVIDLQTGTFTLVEWIYDYQQPNPLASPFTTASQSRIYPPSVWNLDTRSNFERSYLVLGDLAFSALNYPLGMPL